VAGAIVEARVLAGAFRNLGRRARPQLAWRCTKTGEAMLRSRTTLRGLIDERHATQRSHRATS